MFKPFYSIVPPAELNVNPEAKMEIPNGKVTPDSDRIPGALIKEQAWCESIQSILDAKTVDELDSDDITTWAGYNSKAMPEDSVPPKANIGILPLFREKAASVPMIKHVFNISNKLTNFCNPGQTPVVGMDLPIYVIGKRIQWAWKNEHGEDKLFLMLGPLHIEFVIESMLGKLTDGSGFTDIINLSGVLTSGREESLTSSTDSHLKRVRYTHQAFLLACLILRNKAYSHYKDNGGNLDRGQWEDEMKVKSKLFSFWAQVNHLELIHCRFVRSIREGDFELYKQVLSEVADWCHALDQTHYQRWLPVHIKDLVELNEKHPLLRDEFMAGKFVVHRSERRFSGIGKDHSHEQSVKLIKSDSGIANIFDNKDTMDTHIMALPEKILSISQFEKQYVATESTYESSAHHEEAPRNAENICKRRDICYGNIEIQSESLFPRKWSTPRFSDHS